MLSYTERVWLKGTLAVRVLLQLRLRVLRDHFPDAAAVRDAHLVVLEWVRELGLVLE